MQRMTNPSPGRKRHGRQQANILSLLSTDRTCLEAVRLRERDKHLGIQLWSPHSIALAREPVYMHIPHTNTLAWAHTHINAHIQAHTDVSICWDNKPCILISSGHFWNKGTGLWPRCMMYPPFFTSSEIKKKPIATLHFMLNFENI